MSFENLFSILPGGFASKNFIGALITFFNIRLCSVTDARMVAWYK